MMMGHLSHQFSDDLGLNLSYMQYMWDQDLLEHRTANVFAKNIKGENIPHLVEMRASSRTKKFLVMLSTLTLMQIWI